MDSAATTFEPVYLLLVFLALTADETARGSNAAWHAVNRCLGALRNEMYLVADAFEAFLPLIDLASTAEVLRDRSAA